ncbi:MAG: metallophosphoesterase [Candidatus Pacebacteria bacterium]|nr:metallophosphoesterase [Candidatus Paceibacterota bacterium]
MKKVFYLLLYLFLFLSFYNISFATQATVGFISDVHNVTQNGKLVDLVADFNRFLNSSVYPTGRLPDGWSLDAIQTVGDMFYISSSTIATTSVNAFNLSLASTTPLFWGLGNHDIYDGRPYDLQYVQSIFSSYPNWNLNDGPSGSASTTYSYDVGDMHVVVLDQYYDFSTAKTTGTANIRDNLFSWLKDDLRNSDQPYKIVVGHEPAYPYVRHIGDSLDQFSQNRDRFWNLLQTEGVVAHVTGHTHYNKAYEYDGVFEVGLGISASTTRSDAEGFNTKTFLHSSNDYFEIRMIRENDVNNPVIKTISDLDQQILVNTYQGAGTESKYWVDYDSLIAGNPGWSSNNLGKWWQNGFDDSDWTSGELGTGYDKNASSSWGWINETINYDPDSNNVANVNAVFQRVPFDVKNKDLYKNLNLQVDYDDAIIVWINGLKVFESPNAPVFDEDDYQNNFDKNALSDHGSDGDAITTPVYLEYKNINSALNILNEGENTMVIANWNKTSSSSDIISAVKLYLSKADIVINEPEISSPTSITWSWTDNEINSVNSYDLYFTSGTSTIIEDINDTSVVVSNLLPNTSYSVYVKGKNSSDSEDTVSATSSEFYTLAPSPSGLTVSGTSASTISLSANSFNNSNVGSSGYYFSRIGKNSGWISTNAWQDTDLSCGRTYTYNVKYRNANGVETNSISIDASTSRCRSSGGGGGGGGGSVTKTVTPITTSSIDILALLAQLEALLGQQSSISNIQIQDPVSVGSGKNQFYRDLYVGISGEDVLQLQKFLNSIGYIIAVTGPGSVGNESMYFGNLTKQALSRWQLANGLPNTGYFGPMSRGKINPI